MCDAKLKCQDFWNRSKKLLHGRIEFKRLNCIGIKGKAFEIQVVILNFCLNKNIKLLDF